MKCKYIRVGLLFIFITIFVMPGFVSAENKGFERYIFKDGTYYKYIASTIDEYFHIPEDMDKNLLAQVDWKRLNKQVLAIRNEKDIKETEHKVRVQEKATQEILKKKSKTKQKQIKEKQNQQKENSPKKVIVDQEEFEQEVLRLTNVERKKQGLKPLKLDKKLAKVAREKSVDMAVNDYFSHVSPTYGSPFDMMTSFGVKYYSAGENIARGQTSPQEVVQAWMASVGHKENILHPEFTHIGIGFSDDGFHWTQQFIKRLDHDVNQEVFEKQVIELTNIERVKQGLAPLKLDEKLAETARAKSVDMAEHDYFDHTSPTYGSPFDMMDQFGVTYYSAGENIARGQFTPEEVVQAWMNSEGHRANILNANYTHIGVGFVKEDIVWTQQFIGK